MADTKKSDLKTKKTTASVEAFLGKLDPTRREDCRALVAMMKEASGEEPRMWGTAIVGFGEYHYVYESGREGDMCLIGFSPRKAALTLYLSCAIEQEFPAELAKLGKYQTGKGCLYLKRLADVDHGVLRKMIGKSVASARKRKG